MAIEDVRAVVEEEDTVEACLASPLGPDALRAAKVERRSSTHGEELEQQLELCRQVGRFFEFGDDWYTAYEDGGRRIRYRQDGWYRLEFCAEVRSPLSLTEFMAVDTEWDCGGGGDFSAMEGFELLEPKSVCSQKSYAKLSLVGGMFQVDMCTERQTFFHDGCITRRTRSIPEDSPLYKPNDWGVYRVEFDEYVCLRPEGNETVYLHGGAFTAPFLLTSPGITAVANYFGDSVLTGLAEREATPAFQEAIREDKFGLYARTRAIEEHAAKLPGGEPRDWVRI